MTSTTLVLVLISVTLSAVAQVLMKIGMSVPGVSSAVEGGRWTSTAIAVGANPWVLLGLFLYFLSAIVWLAVLSRVQVSLAYPFVGLGFVVTMILGWWFLGDNINTMRVVGTSLIAVGVVLMARSG